MKGRTFEHTIIIIIIVTLILLLLTRVNFLNTQLIEIKSLLNKDVTVIEKIEITPDKEFMSYIGDFNLTAYCSCSKCCGKYAYNRPQVEGKEIVITASGSYAEAGLTIAVDPNIIPYGTKVYIEGIGIRIAQDKGGAIKGNKIDVYYDNHRKALESGLNDRPRKVWIVNEDVNLYS